MHSWTLMLATLVLVAACGDTPDGGDGSTGATTGPAGESTAGESTVGEPTTGTPTTGTPTSDGSTSNDSQSSVSGGPFDDCELGPYVANWAGGGDVPCPGPAVDAPGSEWVTFHDCVLARVAGDVPFDAVWGVGVEQTAFAGRMEDVPGLSYWQFNGAGWTAKGCDGITATANCTPAPGDPCLQCDNPSNAIDDFCVSL